MKIYLKYGQYILFFVLSLYISVAQAADHTEIKHFIALVHGTDAEQETALIRIEETWQNEYSVMIIEAMSFIRQREAYYKLRRLLESKTGQTLGYDRNAWFKWVWSQPYTPHPDYAKFKSEIYKVVDAKFINYFNVDEKATIRLDEIRWGGVRQDGIPPLRQPTMLSVAEADYLNDSDIVFGVEVNNDIRAYPKRILAWHEMFVDTLGGVDIVGVYCTLCGTVIIYDSKVNGKNYYIGTSGFLYRSNKLMYDRDTQSLWSTFSGSPVVGPLVGKGIKFPHRYVVTTTWGEWKKRHPKTKVLSLDTGYIRNYDEGVAYQNYFSTDELMFNVPELDKRLKNKDQVLGLIFNQYPDKPLAISVEYLAKNPIYYDKIEKQTFVALTDKSGAIRVYEDKGIKFVKWDQKNTVIDNQGAKWELSESRLTSEKGKILYRLPANRAFWFGWFSAYSHTRLVL